LGDPVQSIAPVLHCNQCKRAHYRNALTPMQQVISR
jgi:hypothetical protein